MIKIFFSLLIVLGNSMISIPVTHAREKEASNTYGSNIIRLTPLTALDIGVGFGASYEKIVGQGMFGIVLPLSVILENKDVNNIPAYSGYNETRFNVYIYFTPGFKIYPFGQRKITYAIGPNLLWAYGGGNEWQYRTDNNAAYLEDIRTTRTRLGMLVNNYLNFQVTPSLNLGIEGGLGVLYYDRHTIDGSAFYPGNGTFIRSFDITGQFSMTLGFRF